MGFFSSANSLAILPKGIFCLNIYFAKRIPFFFNTQVRADKNALLRKYAKELALLKNPTYCVNPDRTRTDMTGNIGNRDPEDVARVIYETSVHGFNMPFGSDINVWEVIK